MKYYFYALDTDILEQIKPVIDKTLTIEDEDIISEIKTQGEYIKEYNDFDYYKLIAQVGKKNAKHFTKQYIDLVDLKNVYDALKFDTENGQARDFKLSIYKAISQGKGMVIMQHEEPVVVPQKKWYEFWKK